MRNFSKLSYNYVKIGVPLGWTGLSNGTAAVVYCSFCRGLCEMGRLGRPPRPRRECFRNFSLLRRLLSHVVSPLAAASHQSHFIILPFILYTLSLWNTLFFGQNPAFAVVK